MMPLLLMMMTAGPIVVPLQAPPLSHGLSSERIRDTANRVMRQNDYRSVRRRILENITDDTSTRSERGFLQRTLTSMGDAVGDFVDWVFSGMSSPPAKRAPQAAPTSVPARASSSSFEFSFAKLLLFAALAILVVVLIWIFSSVLKASDGQHRIDRHGMFDEDDGLSEISTPPGELAACTYESRAIQMAAAGDFGAAIRELLLGGMSWIERAGMIRFRKGLTNRDYVRALWREKERRFAFGKTALHFERVYFGRREATPEMFNSCLFAFQGAFREEATTTAV